MAKIFFTTHLERHLDSPPQSVGAATVREALEQVSAGNPRLGRYILDDQRKLRPHIVVFVDGKLIEDRRGMSDPVGADSEIYVMQALSGGREQ